MAFEKTTRVSRSLEFIHTRLVYSELSVRVSERVYWCCVCRRCGCANKSIVEVKLCKKETVHHKKKCSVNV